MGEAIGQTLPAAVGVALSPLAIVAVVLMLVSRRGRTNGPAFVLGWIVGLAIIGAVVLGVFGGAGASDESGPKTWVSVLKLVLGVLLLFGASRQWRGRPHDRSEVETPKWMQALDTFTPVKAAGAGALVSAVNPKNSLLAVAAAAAIAGTGIDGGQQAVAYAIFVLVATIGVGAPVVVAFAMGDRSRKLLDELEEWMSGNDAVIMAVLLVVLGAKLIGDGISGL